VAELDDRALARLIALVDADPLPRDRELALAAALASPTLPEAVAWRAPVASQPTATTGRRPSPRSHRALSPAEHDRLPARGADRVAELGDRALARLIALVDADPLPRDRELALAAALASRTLPEVVAWRARVASQPTATTVRRPSPRSHRALSPAEHDQIASCADRDLERALEPVFAGHITGVVAALSERPEGPSVAACNAL